MRNLYHTPFAKAQEVIDEEVDNKSQKLWASSVKRCLLRWQDSHAHERRQQWVLAQDLYNIWNPSTESEELTKLRLSLQNFGNEWLLWEEGLIFFREGCSPWNGYPCFSTRPHIRAHTGSTKWNRLKKRELGVHAKEMAQQLRTLPALPHLDSEHTRNSSQLSETGDSMPLASTGTRHTHIA